MARDDPRMHGFNYGSPFEPFNHPPVYQAAMKIARELGREATKATDKSWQLEMALRDVRHSCSSVEKTKAVQRLESVLAPYLVSTY